MFATFVDYIPKNVTMRDQNSVMAVELVFQRVVATLHHNQFRRVLGAPIGGQN